MKNAEIAGGCLAVLIVAVLLNGINMLVWNWIMPELFNLPQVTFWQMLGIGYLTNMMFNANHTNKKGK